MHVGGFPQPPGHLVAGVSVFDVLPVRCQPGLDEKLYPWIFLLRVFVFLRLGDVVGDEVGSLLEVSQQFVIEVHSELVFEVSD